MLHCHNSSVIQCVCCDTVALGWGKKCDPGGLWCPQCGHTITKIKNLLSLLLLNKVQSRRTWLMNWWKRPFFHSPSLAARSQSRPEAQESFLVANICRWSLVGIGRLYKNGCTTFLVGLVVTGYVLVTMARISMARATFLVGRVQICPGFDQHQRNLSLTIPGKEIIIIMLYCHGKCDENEEITWPPYEGGWGFPHQQYQDLLHPVQSLFLKLIIKILL